MVFAGLEGALLAGSVWGLGAALLLPVLTAVWRGAPDALRFAAPRALAVLACALAAVLGATQLAGAAGASLAWWPGLPGEPFTLGPDALSAPFLLLFGCVGAVSFAAHAREGSPGGASARIALHAAFALALLTVFLARHALLFLLAWEGMTLASAALVAHDLRSARGRTATYAYLALSQLGAAFVAYGLVTLAAHAGSFQFGALADAFGHLDPRDRNALAWCFTIGFAVKLGLVPAHIWLPLAHPEAPAPVSALLSGVMVKAGLYGLLRFAWQMPGAPPEQWGTVLLMLGIASALTGALYAAVESDAKRLLAWSTIKHAGVLVMATGLAALLAADGRREIAGVALAAALYHAVGHGFAKALAFLAVGEAAHAAGTRNLEALGGLARRMPRTSFGALVATLALCGLPPFSCFAGEWLVFQALLLGFSAGAGQLRLLAPFAGAGLALAGALAVAAMVKLYGIGFLGRPRSEGAARAHDAAPGTGVALLLCAVLPFAWGIASPLAAASFGAPLGALLPGFDAARLAEDAGFRLVPAGLQTSSIAPAVAALLIAFFAVLARVWLRAGRGGAPAVRVEPSWACGGVLDARMQYSALAFTKPLRLIFEPVLHAEREVEVLEQGSPYFAKQYQYRSALPAVFENALYQPFVQAVLWTSEQARRLQTGSLHLYLAYLLATLVGLLLWAR
ncbi:MAG: proton-conducting transporter membrane subunit [Candidatus Eisenbacteria bacterium]